MRHPASPAAYAGPAYLHDRVAYNFHMTELQAANLTPKWRRWRRRSPPSDGRRHGGIIVFASQGVPHAFVNCGDTP